MLEFASLLATEPQFLLQEGLKAPCPAPSLSFEFWTAVSPILHSWSCPLPFSVPASLRCLPIYISCSWIAPFTMSSLNLGHFLCCYPQLSQPLQNMVSYRQAVMGNQSVKWSISAASVSGSGAGFTGEDMMRPREREKRSNVAGIDQDGLMDPSVLADPDSCFYEFRGVLIHHKVCEPELTIDQASKVDLDSQSNKKHESIPFPIILLHGFGASVFSWDRIRKQLAKMAGTKVLAFDRPAFGLTSRPNLIGDSTSRSEVYKEINPYSNAFSVQATLSFINFLKSEKAVLMGHSAGCITAVHTYFEAPGQVAALILVAPAIVAPRSVMKQNGRSQESNKEGKPLNTDNLNLLARIGMIISMFFKSMVHTLVKVLKKMSHMVTSLYRKFLSIFLRSIVAVMLIRLIIDKFGIAAIRNAWYDANIVTDAVLVGYTKPLRVKGWERALLEYTISMLTDSSQKQPLSKRLHEIICPVLIVTGDSDRLVPIWNSRRVAQAIPGSSLEVINKCGHLPHEERAEEFLAVVQKFLQNVFHGTHHEGQVQAA